MDRSCKYKNRKILYLWCSILYRSSGIDNLFTDFCIAKANNLNLTTHDMILCEHIEQ